jgi:hypothetical protein
MRNVAAIEIVYCVGIVLIQTGLKIYIVLILQVHRAEMTHCHPVDGLNIT